MSSLAWKLNRLRLMGAPEILWRVQQVLQKKAAKLGVGLVPQPPAPDVSRFGGSFVGADPAGVDVAAVRAAADELLAGRWNVFALRGVELGFPPQWNRDPKTGTEAPRTLGKAIDYRRESVVGDIKYLWEPSRHLELVTLAMAWRATGEARYAEGARTLLQSWFEQCPYPMGVHWTSSLELAVRLLNWAMAWQLLGGEASPLFEGEAGKAFQRQWLAVIYQHCHFITGYFSRHSSANNHLFGEYMGLFVAAVQWPCWAESAGWRELARRGLEEEALKQNTADGVNREQAVYYQHEVMDMMLLCHLFGRANGVAFSAPYMARLERLAEFIVAVMDAGGHVPMIGDSDDAKMVRLACAPGWCHYRSLLASCALLFKRGDFKAKAGSFDDKNAWLFGEAGRAEWDALVPAAAEQPCMAFAEGGYFLLGADFGTPQEVRAVVDCAPLGYLSIAAHGHADALAFTLSVGGEEFLIDPGTYAYHTQKLWRDHFRSTAAHNTVCVDGQDQSQIGGNFMWLRKANARLIRHEVSGAVQLFEGEHDGYTALADPVVHRRRLEFDALARVFKVTDVFECTGEHDLSMGWQWAEHLKVLEAEHGVRVEGASSVLTLQCEWPAAVVQTTAGCDAPPAGWVSRAFDSKLAAPQTIVRVRIHGRAEVVTRLVISAR